MPAAHRSGVDDFLTRGQEHRPAALDELARPADHVRQCRRLRAGGAAGDRRVEQMDAALARRAAHSRIAAWLTVLCTAMMASGCAWASKSVVTAQHALTSGSSRTHTPMMRQRSARSRTPLQPPRTARGQLGDRGRRDVVHPQLFGELQQLARHGRADVAQTDEADAHASGAPLMAASSRIRASSRVGTLGRTSTNSAAAPGGNSKHAASASPTRLRLQGTVEHRSLGQPVRHRLLQRGGSKLATLPVAAAPALNTVTAMRSFLSSCRSSREKCSSAALLAEYSPTCENSSWWRTVDEETLTIRPPPAARRCGMAAWQRRPR